MVKIINKRLMMTKCYDLLDFNDITICMQTIGMVLGLCHSNEIRVFPISIF